MLEPATALTAVGTWLAQKSAEAAWPRLYSYLRPTRLKKEIEAALSSDPDVACLISPAPTLRQEHLNEPATQKLLRTAVTQDTDSLADFLLNEQLIALPMNPQEKPHSYQPVWRCIGSVVMRAVFVAVTKDEDLFKQFLAHSQQLGSLARQEIQGGLETIQAQGAEHAEQLQQITKLLAQDAATAPATAISASAATRTINLLTEQNEQLEQQLRDQLDEKTEKLWELVLDDLQNHNFLEAIAKGQELTEWLDNQSEQVSETVRGRAFLLLAQVALLESSEWGELRDDDCKKARALFVQARDAFGNDISEENELRLRNLNAKLLSIEGRDDDALALLENATDPQSVMTRLLIFIDGGNSETGAALVQHLPIDEKWCEQAAFVFARTGDEKQAQATLDWAGEHEKKGLEHRCRIAIARAAMLRLAEAHRGSALSALRLSEEAKILAEKSLVCLSPILQTCEGRNGVGSGLDCDAVGLAYECYRLLGQIDNARSCVSLLSERQPLDFAYASAMLRGDVSFDGNAAGRLRSDYPNSFVAKDMAIQIDIQAERSPHEILERIDECVELAKSAETREKLARLVVQTATMSGYDVNDKARATTEQLVGEQHLLIRLLDAHRWLASGKLERFENALRALDGEKDFLLEQFRAQLCIKQNNYADAAEILARVGQEMSEPDILKNAAKLALDARPRRLDIVVSALEPAVAICPDDLDANWMLAVAYVQLQGFASAAERFARLRQLEPAENRHAFNHAQCYVQANDPTRALEIFDELCGQRNAPVQALVTRALLLKDLGKPFDAFDSLHRIRDQHWENPEFVLSYMNVASAADEDKFAHEGFQQLWKLRESGQAPPEMLQPKSLEDFVQFNEEAREQRGFLLDQSIAGKLPWLTVESLLQNVPYWGWRIRTQPMAWVFDGARSRASFSVYATNSYSVRTTGARRSLARITSSRRGEPIVADLSALLTLHRLGLLESAIEYFGHVKIPPSYLTRVVQQAGQLRAHQLSQKTSLEGIKTAVDTGKIDVIENDSNRMAIDEYSRDTGSSSYRIRDLLNLLRRGGRISQGQMDEALTVAHKPEVGSSLDGQPEFGDEVVIDLQTLQTLANQQLLEIVCDAFHPVCLSESDSERMKNELRGFALAAETLGWHEDLWNLLSSDDRIDGTTLVVRHRDGGHTSETDDAAVEPTDQDHFAAIDAMLLAEQEKLPLLSDDRVCQNTALRSKTPVSSAAFGTDALLIGLCKSELIEPRKAAQAWLRLVEWRYRFLVIPPSILQIIAKDFAPHDLQKVAKYVHDCMRDPGLFGGPEPTDPPVSIAFRYYQDWLQVIAECVAGRWLDGKVSEEQATEWTHWAMTELVPVVPTAFGQYVGRVANFSAFTVLHYAMLQLCPSDDYSRANTALRSIAHGLSLSNKDFVRVAADVINAHD